MAWFGQDGDSLMPLPLKEFVQQVVLENSRASKIYHAVHRAWNATVEEYPERALWRRKSTFRGLVWEAVVQELAVIAAEDPDIQFIEHRDTASFVMEDSVLFRFKHADVALATANYPTAEASSFDDHDKDLYGFIGLQRVELCYVLNEFETAIVWVGIAARVNGNHLWKLELGHSGIMAAPAELPIFDQNAESDPAKLAKIKKPAQDEGKKEKKDNSGEQ
jgi:hypothetical protein